MKYDSDVMAVQVRAGRAMLGWSQTELAKRCGLAKVTIVKIERGNKNPRLNTVFTILQTLKDAGVSFQEDEFDSAITITVKKGATT